jgi:hypothetical protein
MGSVQIGSDRVNRSERGDGVGAVVWFERQAEACPTLELGWGLGLAVAVNKLWVEIDAAIPLYGVVWNPNFPEFLVIRNFLENTEAEMRLHVEHAFFAVIKCDGQRKISAWQDCGDSGLHVVGSLPAHDQIPIRKQVVLVQLGPCNRKFTLLWWKRSIENLATAANMAALRLPLVEATG